MQNSATAVPIGKQLAWLSLPTILWLWEKSEQAPFSRHYLVKSQVAVISGMQNPSVEFRAILSKESGSILTHFISFVGLCCTTNTQYPSKHFSTSLAVVAVSERHCCVLKSFPTLLGSLIATHCYYVDPPPPITFSLQVFLEHYCTPFPPPELG